MTEEDDPEARFRRFPLALRRWTLRALNRRLRMPFRRRRWDRENRDATAPYRIEDRTGRMPDETGRVCILGDFSGRTGLSRAGLYERELLERDHPGAEIHDLGPALHEGAAITPHDGPPIDRLYLLAAPDTYPALFRALPPARIRKAWRTGLWLWETPLFPAHWNFALDLVDEIWSPSEYGREAFLPVAEGIPIRLRPCPVPAPPAVPRAEADAMRDRLEIARDAFLGVAIMDISSCPARKNPWAHVAAWLRAFGDDPARVLVLKIRVSKITRIVLDELREMIGDAPNVRLLEAELTEDEIAALQAAADVYLSLHRAEGYGLNIHECLALGTPVIATDFSANAEYGPAFSAYRGIPYHLVPYRDWTGHYPDPDFSWAEADQGAAARELRAVAGTGQ